MPPPTLTRRALLALIGASTASALLPGARAATRGHPYLPMTRGLCWRYVTTQASTSAESSEIPEDAAAALAAMPGSHSTETIVELVDDGARLDATLEESWAYNPKPSRYHRIWTSDGVLADVGPMDSPLGPVKTLSARGVFLPPALRPGLAWSYQTSYQSPVSRMEMTGELEVLGEDELGTPAGRFAVLRLRHAVSNTVHTTTTSFPPVSQTQVEDLYFARGVGLVLSASSAGNGLESRKVLISLVSS